MMMRRRWWRR